MTFQAYLDTIKAKTGLGPDEFVELARAKGFLVPDQKATPVQAWLKEEYGLGPGRSMALVSIFREAVAPRASAEERLEAQFAGAKAVWRPVYDALLEKLHGFGTDVSVASTDTYISLLRGSRKFGVVSFTAKRMDVGIKLKGEPETQRLAASGTWNAMVTHRVQVADPSEVDDELLAWLREAYDRAA